MGKKLTRGEWLARNIALPIAKVERPLRYIRDTTSSMEVVDGKPTMVLSSMYNTAKWYADLGKGASVQYLARSVFMGAQ